MKKFAFISTLLSLSLVFQLVLQPAFATPLQTVPAETVPQGTVTEPTVPTFSTIPFGSVSIQDGCRTIEGMVPLSGTKRLLDTAQAAFAFEVTTGTVVYSYNPDTRLDPGSLTKIVTALLAIELCEMDEVVTVNSANISRLPPGSIHVDLKHDEQLSVKDLVYCLMLHSANDAAIALAEHISGNQQGFLVLMNERVKKMGCTNTEFANVHGLSNATNCTTARDMARIVVAAYENETFREVFKTATYEVPATNRSEARPLTTLNYMIDQSIVPQFYDTRVTGGMAHAMGSTASVVSTSHYNDMTMVCVVLGATRVYAENGWSVISYGNFEEMYDLHKYIYDNYKLRRLLFEDQALEQFAVIDGESDAVGMPQVNYDTVLPKDCYMDNLTFNYSVVQGGLTAPIEKEQMIATVAIRYLNSCIAEAEIYSMGNVSSVSGSDVEIRSTAIEKSVEMDGILGFVGVVAVLAIGGFAAYIGLNAFRRAQRRAQRRKRRANRRRSY